MDISIVIPSYNEAASLPELINWIVTVMEQNGFSHEIIVVDDGSKDDSWSVLEQLKSTYPSLKAIKFRRNYGKSAALNVGFEAAQGSVVITMDADLQDSPDEIPQFYKRINEENLDLLSGWKKKRHDPLSKTLPTKLFNAATRMMSGIKNLHDFNCGLKAYKLKVVKNIEIYGEMHRYIPVLAKWAGFVAINEQTVKHYPRKYGHTKFGFRRFINGFLDLLTIFFVGKFSKKPMHFFGTIGTLSFLTGFGITVGLIIQKLVEIGRGQKFRNVTDQPLFYMALVAIVVGFQLFLTGFLAELISRNAPERNTYHIDQTL